jgi:Tol biopolymer transport system component
VEGNPGWRAENDLWIARPRPSTGELIAKRQLLEPAGGGSYGWWGTTYAWSPGGQSLAYARADEVGVVRAYDGRQTPLAQFPPYRTYAPWVWAPGVDWSPEGTFIVTTLHGPAPTGESPEDSPVFDVWALSADGTISAALSSEAGMWAEPSFSPDGEEIVFGRARSPYASHTSGYDLYIMDRDGSNRRLVFPVQEEFGLQYPEMSWGPGGGQIALVYHEDLMLIQIPEGDAYQLTDGGGVTAVQWQGRFVESVEDVDVLPALQRGESD